MIQADPGKKFWPYLQNNQSKKARGMIQGVECLPSKCKALKFTKYVTQKQELPNETKKLNFDFEL
jgi:hypothetical protein